MGKFKIGDKVRCVNTAGGRIMVKDLVGTIKSDHPNDAVMWEGFTKGHTFKDRSGWCVHWDYLVKVDTFRGNK